MRQMPATIALLGLLNAGSAPVPRGEAVQPPSRPPVARAPAARVPAARKSAAASTPTQSVGITVRVIPATPANYVNFLGPSLPNPVSFTTIIRYSCAQPGNLSVKVYSVMGQEVATLANGFHDAGSYSVWWDGTGYAGRLPAGVYLYRMITPNFEKSRRLILLR